MDFDNLIWLLLILAPFVNRMFKRKSPGRTSKPQPRPQELQPTRRERPPREEAPRKTERSPFEEALRQIQEALTEAREQQAREVRPADVLEERPSERRDEADIRQEPVARPRETLFKLPKAPAREPAKAEESFESSAYYDDAFEDEAAFAEPFHETVHTHVPPSEPEPTAKKAPRRRTKWQEAYVMSEILGKPRSKKHWRDS
jgi:hypothetical protein